MLRFSGLNTGYNSMGWIKRYAASGSSHSLQTQKSPSGRMGFFTYLMPGSLWRASCPPPSGPLLRNVQIRSRRICPPQESTHRQTTD
ncbi:hypothetical protein ACBQ88_24840, partial [Citrobacter braakii]|uniref:hypothetical protein n=1 Tax=Citrobacter braakii TaxID=57706 RepID=UPI003524BF3F